MLLLALAGCAQNPKQAQWMEPLSIQAPAVGTTADADDPFESFNRKVYAINHVIDTYSLKPVAQGYRAVVPAPVRDRVHNVLDNLDQPVIFLNQVLQGQFRYAGFTALRFVSNSTFGLGGLNDFATLLGFPEHSGDFGQTLATYGVNSGPYLYLPLFGPNTVRDGAGMGVDIAASPWGYLTPSDLAWLSYAHLGMRAVDARERALDKLDAIERSSLDPYASLRSLYLQYRDAEVRRAETSGAAPINGDDFDVPPVVKKP